MSDKSLASLTDEEFLDSIATPKPKKEDFHPKEIVTPTIKTKIHTMKTYVLELNEEEAIWLRGLMQNPLYNLSPDQEENSNNRMRMAFFNAVKSAGRPNDN